MAHVDDLQAIGYSLEHAWSISRRVTSRLQYLGVKDTPSKRRVQQDGPWAGGIFSTSDKKITKMVTQQKWDKGRNIILSLRQEMSKNNEVVFNYKRLERYRGFLYHLAMVYSIFFPFLEGFHLTLASHLPKRNY